MRERKCLKEKEILKMDNCLFKNVSFEVSGLLFLVNTTNSVSKEIIYINFPIWVPTYRHPSINVI